LQLRRIILDEVARRQRAREQLTRRRVVVDDARVLAVRVDGDAGGEDRLALRLPAIDVGRFSRVLEFRHLDEGRQNVRAGEILAADDRDAGCCLADIAAEVVIDDVAVIAVLVRCHAAHTVDVVAHVVAAAPFAAGELRAIRSLRAGAEWRARALTHDGAGRRARTAGRTVGSAEVALLRGEIEDAVATVALRNRPRGARHRAAGAGAAVAGPRVRTSVALIARIADAVLIRIHLHAELAHRALAAQS